MEPCLYAVLELIDYVTDQSIIVYEGIKTAENFTVAYPREEWKSRWKQP